MLSRSRGRTALRAATCVRPVRRPPRQPPFAYEPQACGTRSRGVCARCRARYRAASRSHRSFGLRQPVRSLRARAHRERSRPTAPWSAACGVEELAKVRQKEIHDPAIAFAEIRLFPVELEACVTPSRLQAHLQHVLDAQRPVNAPIELATAKVAHRDEVREPPRTVGGPQRVVCEAAMCRADLGSHPADRLACVHDDGSGPAVRSWKVTTSHGSGNATTPSTSPAA